MTLTPTTKYDIVIFDKVKAKITDTVTLSTERSPLVKYAY